MGTLRDGFLLAGTELQTTVVSVVTEVFVTSFLIGDDGIDLEDQVLNNVVKVADDIETLNAPGKVVIDNAQKENW